MPDAVPLFPMDIRLDLILSICLGIGLSAACGFRVFIPLLVVSGAAISDYLPLSPEFEWLGTWPAFWTFATAAALEVVAYSVPWIDHMLDTIAGPAAVIAGTVVMASSLSDMNPWLKWTLALIAGGGSATLVQGSSMLVRGLSTALTGGLGNIFVAIGEAAFAVILSLMAVVMPVVAAGVVLALVVVAIRKRKKSFRSPPSS